MNIYTYTNLYTDPAIRNVYTGVIVSPLTEQSEQIVDGTYQVSPDESWTLIAPPSYDTDTLIVTFDVPGQMWTTRLKPASTKEAEIKMIDFLAGATRDKYLTTTSGQEMTYIKKEEDAELFKGDGYPESNISNYPWIQAESIATGTTGQIAADNILAQRDAWVTIGTQIEQIRIAAKIQIVEAVDESAMQTIIIDTRTLFDAV